MAIGSRSISLSTSLPVTLHGPERLLAKNKRTLIMMFQKTFATMAILTAGCSAGNPNDEASLGRNQQAIWFGDDAPAGRWKFMTPGPNCAGGTLIHPKYVLSARHCYTSNGAFDGPLYTPAQLATKTVRPGAHVFTSGDGIPLHPVKVIDNPDSIAADLVLVELPQRVSLPPAGIMTNARAGSTYVGEASVILGWGLDENGGGPDILQQATATFYGAGADCDAATDHNGITSNVICTGSLDMTEGSCYGDSGGPALIRRSGRWFHNGVISITGDGLNCSGINKPPRQVRTASYANWISSTLPQAEARVLLHSVTAAGNGLGAQQQLLDGWGSHWEKIIPGDFNGDGHDDLFFYRSSTGTGLVYFSDASGNLTLKSSGNAFSPGWSTIITGNFTSDAGKELLFYNAATGAAAFYNISSSGALSLVKAATFATKWEQIVPGNFNGAGVDDLFFYAPKTGTGAFFSTDGQGNTSLLSTSTSFGSDWDIVRPGKFNSDALTDLLFYNGTAGTVTYATTNSSGGLATQVTHTGFSADWNEIQPIENSTGRTGFMFYNQSTGGVVWAETLSGGGIGTQTAASGFAKYWSDIIPMRINNQQSLMFYSQWGVY